MPGPRGKGKSKSKPKAVSRPDQPTRHDPFVGDIESVEGWDVIVTMFCDYLELPGL
jgi:hypothetical protein